MNLVNFHGKKVHFINRSKNAEDKVFCLCTDVNKINESKDFIKVYMKY